MHFVNSALLLFMLPGSVTAQTTSALGLSDYVGTYADAPGHTLEIVDGNGLFAVLDGAKYPLRPSGVDQFTTITGQTVPFLRDAKGKVTGYEQDGKFHPRVSTTSHPRPPSWPGRVPKGRTALQTIATICLSICVTDWPSERSRAQTSELQQQMLLCAASSTAHTKMFTASSSTSVDIW
jgi:hypothetical protein